MRDADGYDKSNFDAVLVLRDERVLFALEDACAMLRRMLPIMYRVSRSSVWVVRYAVRDVPVSSVLFMAVVRSFFTMCHISDQFGDARI